MRQTRYPHLAAASLLLALMAAALAGCGESQSKAASASPPPAPQVTVAKPAKKPVADEAEYVGRFVAVDTVEVRARVSGYLEAIHFRDGQVVSAGDRLFTIDGRPFQTALDQARASLEQARANQAFADRDLARGKSLKIDTTISQQSLDQRVQAKRVAEATVRAQEAAMAQAALDLEFTELRAPISGRIGDRHVSRRQPGHRWR